MALPTHVQSSGWVDDISNVVTITLTGVVTGNGIVVGISVTDTAARTFTMTDAQGNTYTQRQRIASTVTAEIWTTENVVTTVGSVVITITASGACVFRGLAVEVGNADPAGSFDTADQFPDAGSTTSHFSAATTAIDTTTDVYCFSVGSMSAGGGTITAGTNWNSLTDDATHTSFAQYRISATALTDERGPWSSSTSRTARSCIASVKGATATGQPTMRRWGGTPFVGGQGTGQQGTAGDSGRMWGRRRSGIVVPRWLAEAA